MDLKETCGMASCSARRVRLGDLKEHQSVHGKVELKVFFGMKTFWKSMHMAGGRSSWKMQKLCLELKIFVSI